MNGACICNVGFNGAKCEYSSLAVSAGAVSAGSEIAGAVSAGAGACPESCNGNGLCIDGACLCSASYVGSSCAVPLRCKDTCLDRCVSEVSLSVCHSCVGECVTMLKNQFVGHHNGFEDLRSTLLQQPPRRLGDVTEHQITNGVSSDAVRRSRPGRQVMLQRSRKRRHHEVFVKRVREANRLYA